MTRNSFAATALALLIVCPGQSTLAEEGNAGKVPAVTPAENELPIRGVAAFSIHRELDQCLKDASALLAEGSGGALHAQVGPAHTFFSQEIGYILRADFTRDDVSPPLINRIVCWHTGQLIASRISAPPLAAESRKVIAVPGANPQQR